MTERYLKAAEIAMILDFKAATIVDWAEAGKIPAYKVGGRLRFRWSEVAAWLEENRTRGHAAPPARLVSLRTTAHEGGEHA